MVGVPVLVLVDVVQPVAVFIHPVAGLFGRAGIHAVEGVVTVLGFGGGTWARVAVAVNVYSIGSVAVLIDLVTHRIQSPRVAGSVFRHAVGAVFEAVLIEVVADLSLGTA